MDKLLAPVLILTVTMATDASLNHFGSQDFDIGPHLWPNGYLQHNSTLGGLSPALGCNFCGEIFYPEPPPDDILYIPSPPLHPSLQADSLASGKEQNGDQCSYCNLFYEPELLLGPNAFGGDTDNRIILLLLLLLLSFSAISAVLCLHFRWFRVIASFMRATIFKSSQSQKPGHPHNKHVSVNHTVLNAHLSESCYLQTNSDKNLTSPIISDHVPHKKTAIPSECWAQPGSVFGRTIRRIPNEYEVPSSQTNSTGTSSAVYADMSNESNNQRFFSPYNLHTYAEVREVLGPAEHLHTSSNSSVYSHGNCVIGSGGVIGPNGSVPMSDFNSMRPNQSMVYGQPVPINHQTMGQATNTTYSRGQPVYEQQPQRAQVIITSNNQGVNPTLLNYHDQIHNVI